MIFSPIPLPLVCNILALQTEVFSEKQRSSTIFSIISIYLVVYMFYLRLHALLTPLRSFTFFLGGGGGGRGERGVGGRRTRWIMRDDAQMANEVRSTNRRQSSNILQRNILQQPTNSWKLRRDKAPNLDPLSVTFAVIRSLAFQNWSIQWGEVGRWEWMFMASSFFHESKWFSSLQAGSLVRAMYDHSFPVLGARPPQIFSGLPQLALSMLAQSMEWPASLSCSDSTDSRSQACTDLLFRCSFCA